MSTSALAPAALDEIATLFVGFELSKATWLIGLYAPQLGKTISRYKIDGGDVDAALERITVARVRHVLLLLLGFRLPLRPPTQPISGNTAVLSALYCADSRWRRTSSSRC